MNPNLTRKIVAQHPTLLSLPKRSVVAHRGIECGDGWYDLIDDTLSRIEQHCATNGSGLPAITQIKEKFGSLRIYLTPTTDAFMSILTAAERKSATICEQCGRPGTLVSAPFPHATCGSNHNGSRNKEL